MSIKKTLAVIPQNEARTIKLWESFGYSLVSSDQVYNEDSHLEFQGDYVFRKTDTTNYVKLVFEYDDAKPNADKLMALHGEAIDIQHSIHDYSWSTTSKIVGGIVILMMFGMIIGFALSIANSIVAGVTCLVLAVGLGILLALVVKNNKHKANQHAQKVAQMTKRLEQIEIERLDLIQ